MPEMGAIMPAMGTCVQNRSLAHAGLRARSGGGESGPVGLADALFTTM
jgi:hypothetical protein